MTLAQVHPKPEIMSPAGYWPQLHAAIEAGADAVYFGLHHFTARAKVGFDMVELPDVMTTLHQRGVKGYVTFNTLVFDHELLDATKAISQIAKAGADSIIVQDLGMARLASEVAPNLEIHGSTQMSITSAEGIELAQQFGVTRVVLARELSLKEIAAIRAATDCEVEIFVHGALCVSYSGQCFSSEAWGGRSANRGQCAQACRLPYDLLVDDVVKPMGDARYLLSPGDLYALHQMPEIVKLGVSALKIEGRYKNADYVALTTKAYRQAVDEAWADQPLSITPLEELQLTQVYSRGLGPHFIAGTNHQSVVEGRAPRHRGVLVGRVTAIQGDRVLVKCENVEEIAPLKPGDGVVFDAADWRSPEEPEEGGHLFYVDRAGGGQLSLAFGSGSVNVNRIRPGDLLWRTHDPGLSKVAKLFTDSSAPVHKQPVRVEVTAHEGQRLKIQWILSSNPTIQVMVQSDEALGMADNRVVDESYLMQQLGRLGNSAYTLTELSLEVEGKPFVPSSLLNNLRRNAVEVLASQQAQREVGTIHDPYKAYMDVVEELETVTAISSGARLGVEPTSNRPRLHLLVRTPQQLEAALTLAPESITLDYLDLYGLRPSVEKVRHQGITVRVASPRILKPAEQRIVNFLLRLDAQILIRSAGLLQALRQKEHPHLIGDFSLNASNLVTSELLLELGLEKITPTHDLNGEQVAELAQNIGPEKLEVVAYHHLPVFHTEHCVFCRFLSDGTSYLDCGKPCEEHKVSLRDIQGRTHPVMADVGCRNTVFGAEAQVADPHLRRWLEVGIQDLRLEFVHESPQEVTEIVQAFRQITEENADFQQLGEHLRQIAPQGITEGSLFVPENYLELTPV
ncbi:MAG: U32 family peptidase [Chloroflexota bacterium]